MVKKVIGTALIIAGICLCGVENPSLGSAVLMLGSLASGAALLGGFKEEEEQGC